MLRFRVFGCLVAAMGLTGLLLPGLSSAGDAKSVLPPEVFETLVKSDAKLIQELLSKEEPDKKSVRKAKGAAFLIAVAADVKAKSSPNVLRESALALLKAIEDGKLADAKKLAGDLTPNFKETGGSSPVAWVKKLDLESVMHNFSSERLGGFGIEKDLGDFIESKDALTAPQLEKVVLLAYRAGLIGIAVGSEDYAKELVDGKEKTTKAWLTFADNMRKEAFALGEAARANNPAGIRKGLESLAASCVKCHDKFR